MGRYNFGKNDIYVGTGGKFDARKDIKQISAEEKEKFAKFFTEHLLKIHYSDDDSYDSSDDDRAGEYYSAYATYTYREVDVEWGVEGLVIHDGEIKGVVFYVHDGDEIYAEVFYFNDDPKNRMTLGYSASHSSHYITVFKVELVKRGENGAPERATSVSFMKYINSPTL